MSVTVIGTIITLVSGAIALGVMIYKWRMNPNRIRKEEDESAKSKREDVTESLKIRDVKKLNEQYREED